MWRIYAAIALAWLLLMPPLFTGGDCTAEFDAEAARIEADMPRIRTYDAAMQYWGERHQPVAVVTPDDCRRAKPRFLSSCGSGPLVYAKVPVRNTICRIYRDPEIKVQLHYDEHGRLMRIATDMDPFKSLPIPFTHTTIHWAR